MAKTDPTANWSKYLWCILIKQTTCQNDIVLPIISDIMRFHPFHPYLQVLSALSRFVFASSSFWSMGISVASAGFQWIQWTAPEPFMSTSPNNSSMSLLVSRCWYSATSVGSCVSLSSSKRTCWPRCGFVGGWTRTKAGGRQIGFFGGGIWNGFFSLHFQMEGGFSAEARISRYVECDYLNQIVLKQWKGWMSDDI